MSSLRTTKRALILISYVLILGIMMYGIGKALVYFNSGADRLQMLKISEETGRFFNPVTTFQIENSKGRIPSKAEWKKLETDYINSTYVISESLKLNDSANLSNYTTAEFRSRIIDQIDYQDSTGISTESVSLNHNLELYYFSMDGKLAVLTDRDVFEYSRTFSEGTLIGDFNGKSNYRIILLLEDGRWRIRTKERTDTSIENLSNNSNNLSLGQLKGINYYPQDHPWQMFGENFSEDIIDQDFELIKNSKLNTIRIFVPYHDFGKEYVNPEMLTQLMALMDVADKHELKVILTLFDFYGDYSINDFTNTHAHLDAVITRVKSHPALLAYDIKNEPDLDFENRGKTNVMSWLKVMMRMLKEKDPDHPVTIGWSDSEVASELSAGVDFVSFHYYEDASSFETAFGSLKDEVKNKPIVLTEYGMSSYSGLWNFWSGSEEKQLKYHQAIQDAISTQGLSSLSWTLYDFKDVPEKVVGKKPWRKLPQENFGFIDEKGRKKPAYQYISTE